MKNILVVAIIILLFFQVFADARGIDEEKLKKKVDEITILGQLDKANEMMGEKTELSSGKQPEGWDTTSMILSMFWGAIGTGYFIYGKKQSRAVFLLCGIALCLFPLFLSGNVLSLIIGLGLTIAPFKIDF